jgi:hypothetical protein
VTSRAFSLRYRYPVAASSPPSRQGAATPSRDGGEDGVTGLIPSTIRVDAPRGGREPAAPDTGPVTPSTKET